jgi:hypothetical protein
VKRPGNTTPRVAKSGSAGRRGAECHRRGAATIDYLLVLCVVLPLAVIAVRIAPRLMLLVYEMFCVLIGWPLM